MLTPQGASFMKEAEKKKSDLTRCIYRLHHFSKAKGVRFDYFKKKQHEMVTY